MNNDSHCEHFQTIESSSIHAIKFKYTCAVDQCVDAYIVDCYQSTFTVLMAHEPMLGVSLPHAVHRLLPAKLKGSFCQAVDFIQGFLTQCS